MTARRSFFLMMVALTIAVASIEGQLAAMRAAYSEMRDTQEILVGAVTRLVEAEMGRDDPQFGTERIR